MLAACTGDTMMIHIGGKNGTSGMIELYRRESTTGWLMGPHILGETGQINLLQPLLAEVQERTVLLTSPGPSFVKRGDPQMTRFSSLRRGS
jgi:hypothetical protein